MKHSKQAKEAEAIRKAQDSGDLLGGVDELLNSFEGTEETSGNVQYLKSHPIQGKLPEPCCVPVLPEDLLEQSKKRVPWGTLTVIGISLLILAALVCYYLGLF